MLRYTRKVLLALAVSSTAALATPADQPGSTPPAAGTGGMMGEHRGSMMGGGMGMMGMMQMMEHCQQMMGNSGMAGPALSMRLPPGNEKLELQMRAEMMQKMGEIAARYAERVQGAR